MKKKENKYLIYSLSAVLLFVFSSCELLVHIENNHDYGSNGEAGQKTNIWSWISGSDISNQSGTYGIKEKSDGKNMPGGRSKAAGCTDKQGNIWLFGGSGYDSNGSLGSLNDLWKFNGIDWIWLSGGNSANQNGVYGTVNIPDGSNMPGSRVLSIIWADSKGNIWLFGGSGYDCDGSNGSLNDLWKFDGSSWTWISGSKTRGAKGIYGSLKIPDSSNMPGARFDTAGWIDSDDRLWLFGGNGIDYNGLYGPLNDLWKFDGAVWTWISGGNAREQLGVYGIKGIPDNANTPGARSGCIKFTGSNGNFIVFGGFAFTSAGTNTVFNDLWKFDGTNWTWMAGNSQGNQYGTYGTKGIADPSNCPGSRQRGAGWSDAAGNIWIFGGEGAYKINETSSYLNDLWKFDGSNWTWVSGSDIAIQIGKYGVKGSYDPANFPGARADSIYCRTNSGEFLLFGGYGMDSSGKGYLNDLWNCKP